MKKQNKTVSPYVYVGLVYDEVIKNREKSKSMKLINEISKQEILQLVANECEVTIAEILSTSRKQIHVDARYLFFAAVRLKFNTSLESIGKLANNRDHSTVLHGLKSFHERYAHEYEYRRKANNVFLQANINYYAAKMTNS